MKKSVILAIFGFFLAFTAEASVVSFYVIETGLSSESRRSQYSIIWENSFMDIFFDSGYIVSNYPMLRLESKPAESIIEAARFDIDEAREAGIDLVMIAQLNYSSILQPPEDVSIYIFTTVQEKIIYEKHYPGKNYRTEREASEDIKVIINELVKFIYKL
jgi:hypothetical protein